MSVKIVLLALLCLLVESYTRIKVNNNCQKQLTITETIDGNRNMLCKLGANGSCYKDYSLTEVSVYFQTGWSYNETLVDVDFNTNYRDHYTIVVDTFDLSIKVSSNNGGETLVCMNKECSDNQKEGQAKVGGIITIDWCPVESFGQKELTLVETVHNPEIINSIKHPRMRRGNKKL